MCRVTRKHTWEHHISSEQLRERLGLDSIECTSRGRAAWGRPVLVPVHLVSQAIVVRGGDGALGRVRGVRRAVPEAVRIRVREKRGTVVLRAGLLFMLFMRNELARH